MAFSRRAISAAFSCLVMALTLPWRWLEATSSDVAEISSSSRTDLMTVLGTMPWALLKASCFSRRRSVSSMARRMEGVMVSAYITTMPSAFRAARPMVWMREVSDRRKPSLSASRMATRETSGRSRPSRSRLIPTSTSKVPSRRSRMISTRSLR